MLFVALYALYTTRPTRFLIIIAMLFFFQQCTKNFLYQYGKLQDSFMFLFALKIKFEWDKMDVKLIKLQTVVLFWTINIIIFNFYQIYLIL